MSETKFALLANLLIIAIIAGSVWWGTGGGSWVSTILHPSHTYTFQFTYTEPSGS